MHIIQRYSLSTGLRIDYPDILLHFFPIGVENYVVFNLQNSVRYEHWAIVKLFSSHLFSKYNIKTVQIGDIESENLNCDIDLRGKTSFQQDNYIINNCKCLIADYGVSCQIAGCLSVPQVTINNFHIKECFEPYWSVYKKTFFLIPEKDNLNSIKPEKIFNCISKLILGENIFDINTIHIGSRYKQNVDDFIPEKTSAIRADRHTNIRMDVFFNEEIMNSALSIKSCEVTTDRAFNINPALAKNIGLINYISDNFDEKFVSEAKALGIKMSLLCSSEDTISRERFKLFDHEISAFFKDKIIKERKELIGENGRSPKIISNKKIICDNKLYGSLCEYTQKEDDFFLDLDWLYVYK